MLQSPDIHPLFYRRRDRGREYIEGDLIIKKSNLASEPRPPASYVPAK